MHLTVALGFFKKFTRLGNPFKGKVRVVPRVENSHKQRAVNRLIQDARNLEVLSKPYVTEAEEYGMGRILRERRNRPHFIERMNARRAERWKEKRPDYSIENHLEHLNKCSKKWE